MKQVKICVVDTAQSGSTRLFNLVRLIYEKIGKKVLSGWKLNLENNNELFSEYEILVSKVHDTDLKYLDDFDIKLLPVRNILDAAKSFTIRRKNFSINEYLYSCNYNIDLFNKFKDNVDFIFKYEEYSVSLIKNLCKILNVKLNYFEIIDI